MNTVVIDLQNISIEDVEVTEDTLTVELSDGRSLRCRSLGIPACIMELLSNAKTGASLAKVSEFIGQR